MSVKHAILGLLHVRNMHGYRIKKRLEHDFGHMWTVNYGQIYPALKKMHQEGLVTMEEMTRSSAPTRKLYSITPKGRKAFSKWVASRPEKKLILRDPFLLRFTFFSFGESDRALAIVDDQIGVYRSQLQTRLEELEKRRNKDLYVRLASELGIDLNRMMLQWLGRARKEIEQNRGNRALRAAASANADEEHEAAMIAVASGA